MRQYLVILASLRCNHRPGPFFLHGGKILRHRLA